MLSRSYRVGQCLTSNGLHAAFAQVQPDARSEKRHEDDCHPLKTPLEIPSTGRATRAHMRPKNQCIRPSVQPGSIVPDRGIGHRIRPARPAIEMSSPGGGMRLLDRLRLAIRTRHYSYRTEQAYVDWTRRCIHFHHKRHPQELAAEVGNFLSHWRRPPRRIVDPDTGPFGASLPLWSGPRRPVPLA